MTTFNSRVARRCARGCVSQCNCRDGPNHYEDFNIWIRTRETEKDRERQRDSRDSLSLSLEQGDTALLSGRKKWQWYRLIIFWCIYCWQTYLFLLPSLFGKITPDISDVNDQTGRHIVILFFDVKTAGVFYWKINSDSFALLYTIAPLYCMETNMCLWSFQVVTYFQDDHTKKGDRRTLFDRYLFLISSSCIKDDIGWGDKEPI